MHSRLVQVLLGAQRLSVFDFLEEKRRTVVFVDCSLVNFVSFFFQMALYLTNRSMVFSIFVIPFFSFDSIVDTILVYLVFIFISIATYRSISALVLLKFNSFVVKLQI